MAIPMRTWHLANGLVVEVLDETVNYYGDYYNVKLTIICPVAVGTGDLEDLEGTPRFGEVKALLGPSVEYRREIIKAGVAGKDLVVLKNRLVDAFEETALPYFEREDFAAKLVKKRFADVEEDLEKRDRAG
jgi:hypothetical protein